MTITIREQVLAALRNNPGLNNAKLAELIGMDTRKISGTVSTLWRRPDQLRRKIRPAPLQPDQLRHALRP
jgi:DNA-binding MarR family transcriptional regulator